jgi:hypothetical protein
MRCSPAGGAMMTTSSGRPPSTRVRAGLRVALPIVMSLAVHGVIAAVVITSALGFSHGDGEGRARAEVVLHLPQAPALPRNEEARSEGVIPPAAVGQALPRLQGLSTPSLAPPPVLRSAASEPLGAGELLLRRTDDSGTGGATFAGVGARRAGSVVYVVDASGAMVSSLKFVLAELERSVRSLSSAQKFQVVLFRERPGGGMYEVFAAPGQGRGPVLVAATPTNKAALAQWLATIAPTGRSNPLDGLKRGLEFEPDAIFLLSRSIRRSGGANGQGLAERETGGVWGRGTSEILAELDRLNPVRRSSGEGRRRVVIKCLQFLEEDPTGTMQAIGAEHGDGPGSYTVLTLQALGAPTVGGGARGGGEPQVR